VRRRGSRTSRTSAREPADPRTRPPSPPDRVPVGMANPAIPPNSCPSGTGGEPSVPAQLPAAASARSEARQYSLQPLIFLCPAEARSVPIDFLPVSRGVPTIPCPRQRGGCPALSAPSSVRSRHPTTRRVHAWRDCSVAAPRRHHDLPVATSCCPDSR
jgi:hypothetical protein